MSTNVADVSLWPPSSIHTNAETIVQECEFMEVSSSLEQNRPLLWPVHMAALIALGDGVHARHLWRRRPLFDETERGTIGKWLEDWWKVAQVLLLKRDDNSVIQLALQKCAHDHPEPLRTYATEIALRLPIQKYPLRETQTLNQDVISFLETKRWNM